MAAADVNDVQPTKKSVYFAMRDVLLDAPAFWRLDDTTVFGFYGKPGVNAVIPWEKLGLHLDPVLGKFSLIGSKIYEAKMGGKSGLRGNAERAVILKPEEHRFILALDKDTGKWYMALPENSVVKVEHWPAYAKETHQCVCVPAPVAVEQEEPPRCFLQNGDIVKIKWGIHPCAARGPEELRFAFYEETDPVDVPPPLFHLPTTALESIFSHFTAREFLDTVGSAAPCLPVDLRSVVPWKRIYLRFNFDSLRVVRLASPAAVETLKATVAPPTGILSAAPDREEFQERFHRLFIGYKLKSLYVWDTAFLVGAPTPPHLKNFKLCLFESDKGPPSLRLKSLAGSPIERMEIAAASGLVGRHVMNALPRLSKMAVSFFPQREFWMSMTKEQLKRITHLSVDLRGTWSTHGPDVPLALMENLCVLRVSEKRPMFSSQLRLGTHPRLHTLAVNLASAEDPTTNSNFWNSVATSAPNLEHLKLTCDDFHDGHCIGFFTPLKSLKLLALVSSSVSLKGIRDMVHFFRQIRYMRVETSNIVREDLPDDAFLCPRNRNRGRISMTWRPRGSGDRWNLTFVFTAFPEKETKKAEDVFKF